MIRIYRQKITILRSRKPVEKSINRELQYLGTSLGLFNLRDKDKSCFRIFIELLRTAKTKQPLTSDEIAHRTQLSRGTVVHHINKLMESGIVVSERNKYMLRVNNLSELIDELQKDILNMCHDLKETAEDIDKKLGL
ncbi:MAG: winged helix-turn-helix domain-containing protein [Candidatus Woesearchaeota archaeon]|jgi:predicted transcriptional regulator|nr:winged helix-turn-helix domain-containing protein [Candidatus Woesearchaeota archaeon]